MQRASQHPAGLGFHFIQCNLSRKGGCVCVCERSIGGNWSFSPPFVLHMEMVILEGAGGKDLLFPAQCRGTIPDTLIKKKKAQF